MAEKNTPAMSLNERHKRFLNNFSSSHLRSSAAPAPAPAPADELKLQSQTRDHDRVLRDQPTDQPNFSGILDFDSPITQSSDDNREECKTTSNDTENDDRASNEKMNSDSEYLSVEKSKSNETEETNSSYEDVSVNQFGEEEEEEGKDDVKQDYNSAGSSFSSSPDPSDIAAKPNIEKKMNQTSNPKEKEKPRKVKLEGKRRLCKVSSDDNRENTSMAFDEPDFSKIMDFGSPGMNDSVDVNEPSVLEKAECDSPPMKIRDILDDLSSKLDSLSIQKKKVTKVETVLDSPVTTAKEEADQVRSDDQGEVKSEYENSDSSDSVAPNLSDSVCGFAVKSTVQGAKNGDEGDRFVDYVGNIKKVNEIQKKDFSIKKTEEAYQVGTDDHCAVKQEYGNETQKDFNVKKTEKAYQLGSDDHRDVRQEYRNETQKKDFAIKKTEKAYQMGRDDHCDVKQEYGKSGSSVSLIPDSPGPLCDSNVKSIVQHVKNGAEGDRFADYVGNVKKLNVTQKKDFSIKKTEALPKDNRIKNLGKSALKENSMVISDDDDDPYLVLGGANPSRKASTTAYRPKEKAKGCISLGTPKDSGSGEWVFEDGESIILDGKPSNYILPGKIAKILYPHQRNGLRWLWSLHCKGTGGILGDDMGLGKTMQICSFLAGLFHSDLIKRVLVVAPKTLLPHWIKELTAVGLSHKIREYYGACAKARQYELQYIFQDKGILLTTYDIVRNNFKSLRGDSYFLHEEEEDNIIWDYTILDEGHIIKNPSTQRAKSLLEIPSGHRIIISGTPIQNNLKELWALFSFCCPELLGDKKEFKAKYESAILRGNEKNATEREKRVGSTIAKELRDRIEPYFLRRLKSEVFVEGEATDGSKLSKKHEIIVWLRLTQCQRQLYEAFLNSELVLSSFVGSPLAALTVLKKICDHPYLLTKRAAEDVLEGMENMLNQDDMTILEKMALHLANATDSVDFQNLIDNVSCKIAFILSLLDDLIPQGHSVLIFSQTRKMLNFVQEAIISKGYKFLRIDGTTKIADREKIVNDFQEGEGAPIFLLTSQVGGLGLTLTKADRVIVVDPAWNPSTDNQSVDRAYRIGQKKDVVVYRLMTCGTIEEKIYRMQVFKGGLFKSATEHKEQTRYFSQQDLRELFSLPKEGFDVSVTQQQLDKEHDQYHIMNGALKDHIKFLKSHDIGGVSHHSLLFSKTEPVQVLEESVLSRREGPTFVGSSMSNSSVERNVDAAEFALNPKDVKNWKTNSPSITPNKLTESEIKDRIHRLQQTYANKAMISRLPDKGEKINRQIADLNSELEKMRMAEHSAPEIIDLDDISGKLERVVHV